jgi:hypothetical protein
VPLPQLSLVLRGKEEEEEAAAAFISVSFI